MQETGVRSLGGEDPLEKEMVTHSSILAWRIPGSKLIELSFNLCYIINLLLSFVWIISKH